MLKKLTLLAMSVAALLALAAPAAQADPLIVDENGDPVTKIEALSTDTITHTAAGTLECTTVKLTGHITTNTSTTATGINGTGSAEGTPNGAGEAKHKGHCAASSGPLVEVTNVNVEHIHLEKTATGTTGSAKFKFTYDLRTAPTPGNLIASCTLGTTATHKVHVTVIGTDTIEIHGFIDKIPGSHTSAFCPGTGSITGKFTVIDDTTKLPVHIT